MNDGTISALRMSLRGLTQRQAALADNIANIETPGYLAKRVDFEASLKNAMQSDEPGSMMLTQSRSMDPTGINGNNVNLDDETVQATDTALRFQLSIEALNSKYRLLRTAIRGS